jgi:hypothetical protein
MQSFVENRKFWEGGYVHGLGRCDRLLMRSRLVEVDRTVRIAEFSFLYDCAPEPEIICKSSLHYLGNYILDTQSE